MKVKNLILCSLLSLPMATMADVLTLADAYHKALQYDATIGASRAENNAQKQEIDKAVAAFLPRARLSMYKGRGITDSETPSSRGSISNHSIYDSQNYSFSVQQSIFNMANFATYSQAKSEVARSDAMLEKENISLISRVSGAYLDALLSTENVRYSQSQKVSIQSQLDQSKRRYTLGVGTITEVSEAQANLDDVAAKSLEWINSLEYSKQAIESLTGEYPEILLALDAVKLPLSVPEPENVDAWIAAALEKNPEILAAQHDLQIVTQEIAKNNSGHYPTLDLVASRARTESDNNYTIGSTYKTDSIGLQLNVPIYSGGYVSASVRQAVAKLEQAKEMLNGKQRSVSSDVRKYFNALINGIAKVGAYEQSVKSNETALIGTQKGYEAGIRTNVEVLNAQEKLFAAKRELARERYQLIFNRIQLKQSAGTLTDADINETSTWLSLSI